MGDVSTTLHMVAVERWVVQRPREDALYHTCITSEFTYDVTSDVTTSSETHGVTWQRRLALAVLLARAQPGPCQTGSLLCELEALRGEDVEEELTHQFGCGGLGPLQAATEPGI